MATTTAVSSAVYREAILARPVPSRNATQAVGSSSGRGLGCSGRSRTGLSGRASKSKARAAKKRGL